MKTLKITAAISPCLEIQTPVKGVESRALLLPECQVSLTSMNNALMSELGCNVRSRRSNRRIPNTPYYFTRKWHVYARGVGKLEEFLKYTTIFIEDW